MILATKEHWVCIGGYHDSQTGEQKEWLEELASLVFLKDGSKVTHKASGKISELFSSNRLRVAEANAK